VLTAGGVLAGTCFVAAGLLALSGRLDQWITLAVAGALIVIVVLQLVRRDRPNAKDGKGQKDSKGQSAPST
jgi:xanthine/uracil permease